MFEPHGSYQLAVNGNILVASLHGAWNIEAAESFSEDFKKAASVLIENDWGHLVFLDDWDMGIPGVKDIIIELVQWCISKNLCCAAHVYSASVFKESYVNGVVVEQLGRFVRHAFDDSGQAMNWLKAEGFYFSNEQYLGINLN